MEYRVYEFNKACELAEKIENRHKNQFLNTINKDAIRFDGSSTTIIRNWIRIKGFRTMATKESTLSAAKAASMQWIKGSADAVSDVAFET